MYVLLGFLRGKLPWYCLEWSLMNRKKSSRYAKSVKNLSRQELEKVSLFKSSRCWPIAGHSDSKMRLSITIAGSYCERSSMRKDSSLTILTIGHQSRCARRSDSRKRQRRRNRALRLYLSGFLTRWECLRRLWLNMAKSLRCRRQLTKSSDLRSSMISRS